MFRREWHREILRVLDALDAEKLADCGFLFGGGTRLALDLDEFRESRDIDFLCSDASGYADLRQHARREGYKALFTAGGLAAFSFPREMRIDQYGIRFPVGLGSSLIKVELIREGRVTLAPAVQPAWSAVACLAAEDCWAVKLLANSDRWPDRQVLSRDLFDLAAMRGQWGPIPEGAWSKAEGAYKGAVREDLRKALEMLSDAAYRRRCVEGLVIEQAEPLFEALKALRAELD